MPAPAFAGQQCAQHCVPEIQSSFEGQTAMEVALVACIGSGLTLWSSGVDGDIPDPMFTNGIDVVRGLARHGDRTDVEQLMAGIVGEIWQEWRNSRRNLEVLVGHLEAFPGLIATHRPVPERITSAIAETRRLQRGGGSADLVAHNLASDIILGARTTGNLTARDLDETLCFFLMSRLISSILSRSDALLAMSTAFDVTFGRPPQTPAVDATASSADLIASQAPPAPPPADAATTAALAKLRAMEDLVATAAESFDVPQDALASIAARKSAHADGMVTAAELEEKALQLAVLAARIAEAPHETQLAAAAAALGRGDLSAVDELLADGEAVARLAKSPPLDDAAREAMTFDAATKDFALPLAWRLMRGQLAELVGAWDVAARHFAVARTLVPAGARQLCGPVLQRQAGALVSQGIENNDEKPLIEAAQVYAEAGGFLSETQAPLEWAQAHVDLGQLMLVLGERESRPERFLAAALHFKPAVEVFSRQHDLDRWAQAQIGLAQALKRTGEFQGDVVTLSDAAFAFSAALGRLTRDRTPTEWADAQLGLGQTLVRIAEETGEAGPLEKAVPALKAALSQSPGSVPSLDIAAAQTALGRAYVSLDAHRQDDLLLQEAISLLESVLASSSRAASASELAIIEQARGTALWSLGERRSSLRLLEDAMRAKLNAAELTEQLGDAVVTGRLREDLDDISELVERMSSRAPRASLMPGHDTIRTA